jgi:hypothetical protein
MLSVIVSHLIALAAGSGSGWYLHYKFGTKLANLAQKVTTDVKELKS